ncbi:MAG: NADH-quinone oxidoreductase subunit J [Bacteroidetes bacterium]|nr:NADH-quinone oxidoreductase subunit J [Bacteroidota bacterium]
MTAEPLLFLFLAAFAVTTAVLMIIQRNPVMSAISLIGNFFCLAALYLMLRAQLLAVLQIAVYAGAIMVLVVFVIMLLNLGDEIKLPVRFGFRRTVGVVLGFGLLLELTYLLLFTPETAEHEMLHADAPLIGTVEAMGTALYSQYLFPLQLTGLLLLAAVVGAVILAKRRLP